ncbi:hypothetical protein NEK97_09285 [Paenarthrobacter sp. UW852]|uniref:hypothetical protein n=1 Tax=Paenarthrobacter sp. UW852 TaxID=2951989 RepID=UPI002148EDD7|nr:hypothetical protein [Paenarthrobacter sp. UW852]MCR1161652.1 hypothetical protein [Paenarthrobacter sp. UW852]
MAKITMHHFGDPGPKKYFWGLTRTFAKHYSLRGPARTLVREVMMGTWGNPPSFDTYFVRACRSLAVSKSERSAFNTVGPRSLTMLADFYESNKEEIDGLSQRFTTLDFISGEATSLALNPAIIVDMFGLQRGFDADKGQQE